jgi:hypothetical protein
MTPKGHTVIERRKGERRTGNISDPETGRRAAVVDRRRAAQHYALRAAIKEVS